MIKTSHSWLYKYIPPYRWVVKILEKYTLPGMQGLRIYTVLGFFIKGFSSNDVNNRASAISFNFFLALFPATIFFFTLIAYIPVANLQEEIFNFLRNVLPHNAFEAIQSTLIDIVQNRQGGLLSFGFLTAMYFSTTGISSLMEAFNDYTHSVQIRKGWKQKLTALGLTMYVIGLVVFTIILNIVFNLVLDFLYGKHFIGDSLEYYLLIGIKWLVTILFMFSLVSGLYSFGAAKKRKWPFFSVGSVVATLLSMATTYGFTMYVNNFNSYNKLYGSIGTLMVIMLLIYINAMVILIGFELNVSIDKAISHHMDPAKLSPEKLEEELKSTDEDEK